MIINKTELYISHKFFLICIFLFSSTISFMSCSLHKNSSLEQQKYRLVKDTLFIMKDIIEIKKPIILKNNMVLDGKNSLVIRANGYHGSVIDIRNSNNVAVKNLTIKNHFITDIRNNDSLKILNFENAININGSNNIIIQDCNFTKIYGTGIKLLDSKNVIIKNCSFDSIGVRTISGATYSYDGVFIGGRDKTELITIDCCKFSNIGNIVINKHSNNDADGIHLLMLQNGTLSNVIINNCVFENIDSRGVKIQSGREISITNSKFINCRSSCMMPMNQTIENILIKNNYIIDCTMPFGTNSPLNNPINAHSLQIINNKINKCDHFFRTNGSSTIINGLIKENVVDEVERFFVSGRFIDTKIINNIIKAYATKSDPSWNMSILLLEDSDNVVIEGNKISNPMESKRSIVNRSKNNILINQ
jgi:pectate lyase